MSTANTARAGGGYREAATRLVRVVSSAVPFGSIWYPADTGRFLRGLAPRRDFPVFTAVEGLAPADLARLAPGMGRAEFLAFLGDAVEEDGGGTPFPSARHLPMTPAEARLRYPVLAETRPGDALPVHVRADLHAEIRHAAVLFATDNMLRANLGHTVGGIRHDMLDTWAATPTGCHAAPVVRAAEPHEEAPVDGVPAALLTLCAEEATRPAPEPLTAVERFLRLDLWGAPLGAMRRVGDVSRDLRSDHPSPEGAYRRLAEGLIGSLPDRTDAPARHSILTSLADEVDGLDGHPVTAASELPMSAWEARTRYPRIEELSHAVDYGDRPTAMANLTEEIDEGCYAGCRLGLAALVAEIAHMRTYFGSSDALRENLSGAFSWVRDLGVLDEAASVAEAHLTRRHPAE
ncbi:hypothetical protein POF50_033180 [Streptomyces sp. SL13]|uniref:Uncharacterized protein n=1 Tax=Streptantibioticus silvisoli TaxID=2705255 RepID=A0AA90KBU6_9ACTN|nr:hypothetical protein [Streptantibioticus silvisoli]MDI5974143.1 hypothetical protein [Streptantibioticus silvisoli]